MVAVGFYLFLRTVPPVRLLRAMRGDQKGRNYVTNFTFFSFSFRTIKFE